MTSSRALITSASNKFFPSLLNLLGSIEKNYSHHPDVYVYDLGLFYSFKKELERFSWVHLLEMPHFAPHWRSCYTWKTYILNSPLADLNLYIDAGCQVERDLNPLFEIIKKEHCLVVGQGYQTTVADCTPPDYFELLHIDQSINGKEMITAGIFGFDTSTEIKKMTEELYTCGVAGLCLGFSETELWKNNGVNKTSFVRDCKMFRHDTTLLTLFLYRDFPHLIVQPVEQFSAHKEAGIQYIWNFRLNYEKLEFLNSESFFNRAYISLFLFMKKINSKIKSK